MRKELCVILALVLLLFPALVAVAVVQAQEIPSLPPPSPWVTISANPSEIPADGVSTAEIKVVVSWPEEIGGGLAVNTSVDIWTTLGRLTEAGNESNSGSNISLDMDYNGTATALLSGNETGVAEIKVWWSADEKNITSTSVTFLEPGATPTAPSGDGNGGNGGAAVTTPTPAPTGAVNVTPSPEATVTQSPAVSVTPTTTATATATATATPEKRWQIPGFEAVLAIASLLSVAYLVMRRRKA